jgi:hypothetical protein
VLLFGRGGVAQRAPCGVANQSAFTCFQGFRVMLTYRLWSIGSREKCSPNLQSSRLPAQPRRYSFGYFHLWHHAACLSMSGTSLDLRPANRGSRPYSITPLPSGIRQPLSAKPMTKSIGVPLERQRKIARRTAHRRSCLDHDGARYRALAGKQASRRTWIGSPGASTMCGKSRSSSSR